MRHMKNSGAGCEASEVIGTLEEIRRAVSAYYTDKVKQHGPTALGVDWNSIVSQELRFSQVAKVIEPGDGFSINDLGCGYGALVPFLTARFPQFQYLGLDWSPVMIEEATRLYGHVPGCRFSTECESAPKADYAMASGIFNVKLAQPDSDWMQYILESLGALDRMSNKGFSFNILTSYSDSEYMRGDLFYADPCFFFDYCKRHFSKQVAVLHDYGLYEFTILVRKENA